MADNDTTTTAAQNVPETSETTTPVVAEETLSSEPATTPAPAPAASTSTPDASVPDDAPVYGEEPVVAAVVDSAVVEDHSPNVVKLNELLHRFADAATSPGKKPEDYREAAQLSLAITRFVCTNASRPVIDALLAYFVAEKDGVMTPQIMFQGSLTLSKNDEQKVGYLFTVFLDLAHRRQLSIDLNQITGVLGQTDIVRYYERKMRGIVANS